MCPFFGLECCCSVRQPFELLALAILLFRGVRTDVACAMQSASHVFPVFPWFVCTILEYVGFLVFVSCCDESFEYSIVLICE